jgi:hypothetical protein
MGIDPSRSQQGDGSEQCLPKTVEEYLQVEWEGTREGGWGKKIYLFEDLPSIDYGEGGCHRDQSDNDIISEHEPRLVSEGGTSEFSF